MDDAIYLITALLLFISLFPLAPLPKGLEPVKNGLLGLEWTIFRLSKITGTVTDATMCVLGDLWSIGGMEVTYRTVDGALENSTCALLTENKIAITPKDVEDFGDELAGEAVSFTITDKWAVNRVFYFSYVLFGAFLMSILMDLFNSTGLTRKHGVISKAAMITITIGLTAVTLRTSVLGGMKTWGLFGYTLGQSNSFFGMTVVALTIFFSTALVMFAFHQILEGYNLAKETYIAYSGLQTAVKADLERGKQAQKLINQKDGKV